MKRLVLLLVAWFTLSFSIAQAVPARLPYEPDEPPKLPTPVLFEIQGTGWSGTYLTSKIQRVYIFEPDGTLSYRSVTSPAIFRKRGSWKLQGNKLSFEFAIKAKIFEFQGTIQDRDTISGESITTTTGKRAPMILKRTDAPLPKPFIKN